MKIEIGNIKKIKSAFGNINAVLDEIKMTYHSMDLKTFLFYF
jgi:hypothetical protein